MSEPVKASKGWPFGTKHKFFELDGIPVRMLEEDAIPEIYRGNDVWEPWPYISRLIRGDAMPVSEGEFNDLVWEADGN